MEDSVTFKILSRVFTFTSKHGQILYLTVLWSTSKMSQTLTCLKILWYIISESIIFQVVGEGGFLFVCLFVCLFVFFLGGWLVGWFCFASFCFRFDLMLGILGGFVVVFGFWFLDRKNFSVTFKRT